MVDVIAAEQALSQQEIDALYFTAPSFLQIMLSMLILSGLLRLLLQRSHHNQCNRGVLSLCWTMTLLSRH